MEVNPKDCTEDQDVPVRFMLLFRIAPKAAEVKPEDARTDNSAASSISRRIDVTERKTPGSMGGGVAFPGGVGGKRGGICIGIGEYTHCGDSGGVLLQSEEKLRSR